MEGWRDGGREGGREIHIKRVSDTLTWFPA